MSDITSPVTAPVSAPVEQTPGQEMAAKVAKTLKGEEKGITKETLKAKTGKVEEKAAEPTPQKFKVVRQGKEQEVDAETYHRWAQKGAATDAELAAAKALKRELEQEKQVIENTKRQIEELKKQKPSQRVRGLLEELQDNPEAITEFRGTVEEWLVEKLKEESASPELRRALAAERELEKHKKTETQKAEEAKRAAWQQKISEERPAQEKLIIDTLKLTGLPSTEWNVKSVADVIFNARAKGHRPSPEQVAAIVKEDRIDNIRAVAGDVSKQITEAHKAKDFNTVLKLGDQLTDIFGEDILKALRVYDIRKHLSGVPEVPKAPVETPKMDSKNEKGAYEFKNMDEWVEARRRAVQSMTK